MEPQRSPMRLAAAVFVAVAFVLILSGCETRPMPSTMASTNPATNYRLGPGDQMRINVFGDETLTGEHKVDGSGNVTLPLVGAVEAAGRTPAELTVRIEDKLREYMHRPRVNIQLLSNRPVYVIGEVNRPGSYAYVDGMTVIKAVAIAGGFTYRARTGRFILDRSASAGGALAATSDTPLLPGDVVTVQERYF